MPWNDTAPTSSLITVSDSNFINADTDTYVIWCWSEVEGYSSMGGYTGNGSSTNGTFVHTGFEPAFVLVKKFSASDNWEMWDNKRSTFNQRDNALKPDDTSADATGRTLDFLSNGVKLRVAGSGVNNSGFNYLYMAFAEAPFVNSNGVPCNAR